jgi:membrane protease YdiL (CAAX protease family)
MIGRMNLEINKTFKYSVVTIIFSAMLWFALFVLKPMNFWIEMSLSILLLVAMAFIIKRDIFKVGKIKCRHVIIGVLSAIGLYMLFYIGNIILGYILPFKDVQVLSIYGNKSGTNQYLIGFLLLFLIGPGEELYWHGFIQKTLSKKFGGNKGYIFATIIYAAVHIVTGNLMLIIAALVCGTFWGWIYKKEKSLVPVIISHAIWDLTIFVLLPLM